MPTFYSEIADRFQDYLRDDIMDAIEACCITQAQWNEDPDDCVKRVYAALEEMQGFGFNFNDDGQPDWAQEWADFGEEY